MRQIPELNVSQGSFGTPVSKKKWDGTQTLHSKCITKGLRDENYYLTRRIDRGICKHGSAYQLAFLVTLFFQEKDKLGKFVPVTSKIFILITFQGIMYHYSFWEGRGFHPRKIYCDSRLRKQEGCGGEWQKWIARNRWHITINEIVSSYWNDNKGDKSKKDWMQHKGILINNKKQWSNKLLIQQHRWITKNITLSNRSQTQKSACPVFTFMGCSRTGKTVTIYGGNNEKNGCISGVGWEAEWGPERGIGELPGVIKCPIVIEKYMTWYKYLSKLIYQ